MIDRIGHDIQQRLGHLRDEAERPGRALAALDPREKPTRPRSTRPIAASGATAKRRSAAPPQRTATKPRARTAPGATKAAVLAALSKGGAMTAGEVATATGLGCATVSTTLSKLAKSGEVTKAERGYRLAEGSRRTA